MKRIETLLAATLTCVVGVHADVVIETVPVGNAGNAGEWAGASYGGYGPDRVCGAVDYVYSMGKFEVTAGQYCEFLNAVAGIDTYQLYDEGMWAYGASCKIERFGGNGSEADPYQYRVAQDRVNRPVTFVTWANAARFANWMHNGQPTGPQGPGTTENGSYLFDDTTTEDVPYAANRTAYATWVIPTEDEWYKAAYHKNDGTTDHYFDYATSSDVVPSNDLVDPDLGNSATFLDDDYTIGGPYWRTEVGTHEQSASPYGTFDQGGNVWELTEIYDGRVHWARGGSYDWEGTNLHAAVRRCFGLGVEGRAISMGVRLALVPEPGTLFLLVLGGLCVMRGRCVRSGLRPEDVVLAT